MNRPFLRWQGYRVPRSPSPPERWRSSPSTLSWFSLPMRSWSVHLLTAQNDNHVAIDLFLSVFLPRVDEEEHTEQPAVRGAGSGLRLPALPFLDCRHGQAHVLRQVLAARGALLLFDYSLHPAACSDFCSGFSCPA